MDFSKGFLIAEIGSVHDGSFGNAQKLIDAAADAGAHAVKFQTHIADAETLPDAPMPPYFKGEPRFEYFERTSFTEEQWRALAERCREKKVEFISSPFSLEAVDLLERVGVRIYKIPSGEVTNIPLMEKVGRTGKPVIVSSGMSDWTELDAAVAALPVSSDLVVMQCSTAYPCPAEKVGLNVVGEIEARYRERLRAVGFSDHTLGVAASLGAAALGARVIEKHFTFSKLMYGSDAAHSMEPDEFKAFAAGLAELWTILNHPVDKSDNSEYGEMKRIFEKSIVLKTDLSGGTELTLDHLAFKKPGSGIPAARYRAIIGRRLKNSARANHLLQESDLL